MAQQASFAPVRTKVFAWVVAAGLAAVGSVWAHALAYQLVEPGSTAHARLLADSGHGYLEHTPLALAIVLSVVGLALGLRAAAAYSGRRPGRPPAWSFALAPLAAFALQEHLERLLHDAAFPLTAALEPTFLVGILLQIPFALAALFVARALLGAADRLGHSLAALPAYPRSPASPVLLVAPCATDLPRPHPLAHCAAERGPPFFIAT
jgi:hypothetical protein